MDLSKISLASLSLDSSTYADIVCGSNGLPLTPNSIKIIGDFKARVESVTHPNLIQYVECFRNKNERVTLVFENLPSQPPSNVDYFEVAQDILNALDYLHNSVDCVHGILSSECIVWSGTRVKINHWAINLLTEGGAALGAKTIYSRQLHMLAPELVKYPQTRKSKSSDIWAAGMILLKLMKFSCRLPENPCRLAFCDTSEQLLANIEARFEGPSSGSSTMWEEFFRKALDPDPVRRASLDELFQILNLTKIQPCTYPFENVLDTEAYVKKNAELSNLNISEIYHLWRLSLGRNLESEQKQDDYPPIFKIPCLIVTEKQANHPPDVQLKPYLLIDTTPKVIPLDKFKSDMLKLDEKIFYPLILTDEEILISQDRRSSATTLNSNISNECNNNKKSCEAFTFADLDNLSIKSNIQTQVRESSKILPIVIKEADFAYQCERIALFKKLIAGCPFLEDHLKREASIDIPPYYRAQTWAILLGVCPRNSAILYDSIDKTTPVATDRQISVDIPRCHQYNELMASPQGHQKLARILKAWLNHNSSEYVYWQGLDSLAAPFLLLNFDNEALAFSSFNAFVNKYLRGFFKKDNQIIVQQYLTMFSELLSYHDASLASHLEALGFLPNLYAIPWFLTMFTHVLPLHKILHVWDCLLLGDEKFPLCIGLAILNQLRRDLMNYNFNDCIVAFSDLPEIDIERCITDAAHFYNSTPDRLIDFCKIRDQQESSW